MVELSLPLRQTNHELVSHSLVWLGIRLWQSVEGGPYGNEDFHLLYGKQNALADSTRRERHHPCSRALEGWRVQTGKPQRLRLVWAPLPLRE